MRILMATSLPTLRHSRERKPGLQHASVVGGVVNNSAMHSAISWKFDRPVHYESPQAAGWLKYTSGETEDGGRRTGDAQVGHIEAKSQ